MEADVAIHSPTESWSSASLAGSADKSAFPELFLRGPPPSTSPTGISGNSGTTISGQAFQPRNMMRDPAQYQPARSGRKRHQGSAHRIQMKPTRSFEDQVDTPSSLTTHRVTTGTSSGGIGYGLTGVSPPGGSHGGMTSGDHHNHRVANLNSGSGGSQGITNTPAAKVDDPTPKTGRGRSGSGDGRRIPTLTSSSSHPSSPKPVPHSSASSPSAKTSPSVKSPLGSASPKARPARDGARQVPGSPGPGRGGKRQISEKSPGGRRRGNRSRGGRAGEEAATPTSRGIPTLVKSDAHSSTTATASKEKLASPPQPEQSEFTSSATATGQSCVREDGGSSVAERPMNCPAPRHPTSLDLGIKGSKTSSSSSSRVILEVKDGPTLTYTPSEYMLSDSGGTDDNRASSFSGNVTGSQNDLPPHSSSLPSPPIYHQSRMVPTTSEPFDQWDLTAALPPDTSSRVPQLPRETEDSRRQPYPPPHSHQLGTEPSLPQPAATTRKTSIPHDEIVVGPKRPICYDIFLQEDEQSSASAVPSTSGQTSKPASGGSSSLPSPARKKKLQSARGKPASHSQDDSSSQPPLNVPVSRSAEFAADGPFRSGASNFDEEHPRYAEVEEEADARHVLPDSSIQETSSGRVVGKGTRHRDSGGFRSSSISMQMKAGVRHDDIVVGPRKPLTLAADDDEDCNSPLLGGKYEPELAEDLAISPAASLLGGKKDTHTTDNTVTVMATEMIDTTSSPYTMDQALCSPITKTPALTTNEQRRAKDKQNARSRRAARKGENVSAESGYATDITGRVEQQPITDQPRSNQMPFVEPKLPSYPRGAVDTEIDFSNMYNAHHPQTLKSFAVSDNHQSPRLFAPYGSNQGNVAPAHPEPHHDRAPCPQQEPSSPSPSPGSTRRRSRLQQPKSCSSPPVRRHIEPAKLHALSSIPVPVGSEPATSPPNKPSPVGSSSSTPGTNTSKLPVSSSSSSSSTLPRLHHSSLPRHTPTSPYSSSSLPRQPSSSRTRHNSGPYNTDLSLYTGQEGDDIDTLFDGQTSSIADSHHPTVRKDSWDDTPLPSHSHQPASTLDQSAIDQISSHPCASNQWPEPYTDPYSTHQQTQFTQAAAGNYSAPPIPFPAGQHFTSIHQSHIPQAARHSAGPPAPSATSQHCAPRQTSKASQQQPSITDLFSTREVARLEAAVAQTNKIPSRDKIPRSPPQPRTPFVPPAPQPEPSPGSQSDNANNSNLNSIVLDNQTSKVNQISETSKAKHQTFKEGLNDTSQATSHSSETPKKAHNGLVGPQKESSPSPIICPQCSERCSSPSVQAHAKAQPCISKTVSTQYPEIHEPADDKLEDSNTAASEPCKEANNDNCDPTSSTYIQAQVSSHPPYQDKENVSTPPQEGISNSSAENKTQSTSDQMYANAGKSAETLNSSIGTELSSTGDQLPPEMSPPARPHTPTSAPTSTQSTPAKKKPSSLALENLSNSHPMIDSSAVAQLEHSFELSDSEEKSSKKETAKEKKAREKREKKAREKMEKKAAKEKSGKKSKKKKGKDAVKESQASLLQSDAEKDSTANIESSSGQRASSPVKPRLHRSAEHLSGDASLSVFNSSGDLRDQTEASSDASDKVLAKTTGAVPTETPDKRSTPPRAFPSLVDSISPLRKLSQHDVTSAKGRGQGGLPRRVGSDRSREILRRGSERGVVPVGKHDPSGEHLKKATSLKELCQSMASLLKIDNDRAAAMLTSSLSQRQDLVDGLDADPILDYLQHHGVLSPGAVGSSLTSSQRNCALLQHVESHGQTAVALFINALRQSGQLHLASSLDTEQRIKPASGGGYFGQGRHKGEVTIRLEVEALKLWAPREPRSDPSIDPSLLDHTSARRGLDFDDEDQVKPRSCWCFCFSRRRGRSTSSSKKTKSSDRKKNSSATRYMETGQAESSDIATGKRHRSKSKEKKKKDKGKKAEVSLEVGGWEGGQGDLSKVPDVVFSTRSDHADSSAPPSATTKDGSSKPPAVKGDPIIMEYDPQLELVKLRAGQEELASPTRQGGPIGIMCEQWKSSGKFFLQKSGLLCTHIVQQFHEEMVKYFEQDRGTLVLDVLSEGAAILVVNICMKRSQIEALQSDVERGSLLEKFKDRFLSQVDLSMWDIRGVQYRFVLDTQQLETSLSELS